MEVLFIVLNEHKVFDRLLDELQEKGFYGGTILESQGMAHFIVNSSSGVSYSYLRSMFNKDLPYNKTLFMILDEDRIESAKECVRGVVGDLERENVGIMFTFPISSVEGLTK